MAITKEERTIVGVTQYVSDHVVGCWGSGESLDDAIEDYEHNLLEAYEDLIAAGENLSRLAQERLDLLRSFLDLPRWCVGYEDGNELLCIEFGNCDGLIWGEKKWQ